MDTVHKTQRQPTARLTVQVGYEDILTAVHSWRPEDLEGLVTDLQAMIQDRKAARAEVSALLNKNANQQNPNRTTYSDEEVEAVRWQALAEKYHLLDAPLPRKKASLADMMAILPLDAKAPSDEEVAEIRIAARLERIGE